MVDTNLRLRRFTPNAEKIFNLLPADTGRPIGDFRPKLEVPDLPRLLTDVIDHLMIQEREVQDKDGRSYSMWIRPYRTADNKIDGAVMTLFDITDRKNITDARYRRLFEAAREGIVIVEARTGTVMDANPFILALLGYTSAELVGSHLWDASILTASDVKAIAATVAAGETWRRDRLHQPDRAIRGGRDQQQ
jgi:two-component system CheB/CheR fusion protein